MTATATKPEVSFFGGIRQMMSCRDPRVLVEGPAGTGKTMGDLWRIRLLCEKYPGSRHWIGRDTRASMTDSVLVTLEDKVLGRTHPSVSGPSRDTRREYRFANGSAIIVGGLDKPERTFSAEYDTMTVFEAIEIDEGACELLQRALRNGKMPYHQLKIETNPGAPTHWINQWANSGKITRIITRHEDNPALYDHASGDWTQFGRQYLVNLETLTGHRKERLRFGKWVAAEGVVYSEFDARVHVIDQMPEGWNRWPKYRVIDFGFNDPFVCQWWAVNDDAAYMYREIYMSQRIVEDHAKQIVRLSEGEDYAASIADHDREDRATLSRHGVDTVNANKVDILQGIDHVKTRLAVQKNGKPRMYFLKGCTVEQDQFLADQKRPTSTLAEMDCYIYAKTKDGIAKDKPEDRDNHGMDCCRYLAMQLDNGPAMFAAWAGPQLTRANTQVTMPTFGAAAILDDEDSWERWG